MDWIFDNLEIVIFVVFAISSWLTSRRQAKKNEEVEDYEPEEDSEPEEYSEPAPRRQPSVPPPLASMPRPVASIPPPLARRMAPAELPAFAEDRANEAAAMLKHQQDLEERLRQIRETKATTSGGASATRARIAAKTTSAKPVSSARLSLRASLRSRKEVRRAIVMREVLGTPLGLR